MNPRLKPLLLIGIIAASLISFQLGATWSQNAMKTRITETAEQIVEKWLQENYGVNTIDELIEPATQPRYHGNPFTTRIQPGQLQAENLTFWHLYQWTPSNLINKTDILAYPE